MLRIAIIDDESVFAKKLEAIISKYMNKKQFQFEIDRYHSGTQFSDLGIEMARYHILFCDINMEEQDGIETAQKLREICKDTYIIFVTAYIKYTLEGYKVEAIRYILKNTINFKDMVYEALDAICEKMNYVPNIREFKFKEGKKEISLERISYIESDLHKLRFHVLETNYVEYTLFDTLNNIESDLGQVFYVRIHQSYLVNLRFVTDIVNYKLYLINGTVLPVAKARYKNVREQFAVFKGEI